MLPIAQPFVTRIGIAFPKAITATLPSIPTEMSGCTQDAFYAAHYARRGDPGQTTPAFLISDSGKSVSLAAD